jgi:hypothetical protein
MQRWEAKWPESGRQVMLEEGLMENLQPGGVLLVAAMFLVLISRQWMEPDIPIYRGCLWRSHFLAASLMHRLGSHQAQDTCMSQTDCAASQRFCRSRMARSWQSRLNSKQHLAMAAYAPKSESRAVITRIYRPLANYPMTRRRTRLLRRTILPRCSMQPHASSTAGSGLTRPIDANEFTVTPGASGAVMVILSSLCDEGESILVSTLY